jgi:signal transduction histidine kinase
VYSGNCFCGLDKDFMTDMNREKGSQTAWTGLQSVTRLQDIKGPCASRSSGPRVRRLSEWLFTSVVHDLRNPLATICASAEILMSADAAPAQVKRVAANMHRAAGRMSDLLAEVSRLTYGKNSAAEICYIDQVIDAASEAACAAMYERRVQVLLDVPTGIELLLERSRIERVFVNVITNAIEAMSGGGEVHIKATKTGDWVLVEIEDTGPGIPREIRDRIFEPFVTVGKTNGIGLGLALSRRAVLDQGGDMWIAAAAGARFVIRLPLNGRKVP